MTASDARPPSDTGTTGWHMLGDLGKQIRPNNDGCWEWLGETARGYGRTARPRVTVHRLVYEILVGPIPDGMVLDHLCHDPDHCKSGQACPHRRCVNPAHLTVTTGRQNILRGGGPPALNASKESCGQGHPFTPDNTYVDPRGHRVCRRCRRDRQNARKDTCPTCGVTIASHHMKRHQRRTHA